MNRYNTPRQFMEGAEKDLWRELATSVRGILKGQTNNTYEATLAADADTTVVTVEHASLGGIAVFNATSASAAASAENIWTETKKGQVIIHHDSSPATDRTVALLVMG